MAHPVMKANKVSIAQWLDFVKRTIRSRLRAPTRWTISGPWLDLIVTSAAEKHTLWVNRPLRIQLSRVLLISIRTGRTGADCPFFQFFLSQTALRERGCAVAATINCLNPPPAYSFQWTELWREQRTEDVSATPNGEGTGHRSQPSSHEAVVMRFTTRLASNALVWLSAALLPVQTAFPSTCGCERAGRDAIGQARSTPPKQRCHSGCCWGSGLSACCAASGTAQRACCASRAAVPSESACADGLCRCASGESSTPAPTRSDNSTSAKEVLGHPNLGVVALLTVRPQSDGVTAPGDVAALPRTSLERLSALCRFLI